VFPLIPSPTVSESHRRRVDVMLSPEYLEGIDEMSLDDVRALRDECNEVETEVSYVRRLAQARIDILQAELDRRAAGGSTGDLVASLASILADPPSKPGSDSGPRTTRLPRLLAPSMEIEWKRGLEYLIADATLVNLPMLSEDELASTMELLRQLERDVSTRRRGLHAVIDRLESVMVERHRADTA
jgi:hypothetical protein